MRAKGYFHADMRHLSRWVLHVAGEPPQTLSSNVVDYYSARVAGAACTDED